MEAVSSCRVAQRGGAAVAAGRSLGAMARRFAGPSSLSSPLQMQPVRGRIAPGSLSSKSACRAKIALPPVARSARRAAAGAGSMAKGRRSVQVYAASVAGEGRSRGCLALG